MRNHPGRRITVDLLGSLFNEAYLKYATLSNAVSGFKSSVIFPFNPEIIPEHELIDDPRDIHGSTNETEESNAAFVCVCASVCVYILPPSRLLPTVRYPRHT